MKPHFKISVNLFAILSLLGLSGCSGEALRNDYADYSEVYADSINRQMLLNLARLSRNEPAYFIQLGTISSESQFTASAGFAPSHTASHGHPGTMAPNGYEHIFTLSGTIGAGVTKTPVFSFVPLNGSEFAEKVTSPISDSVFFGFYDQGYHADILARTMIGSIEVDSSDGKGGHEFYVNNPHSPTYPIFLEYCDKLKSAQRIHTLIVQRKATVQVNVKYETAPKLNEIASLVQQGLSLTQSTAKEGEYSILKPQDDHLELAYNSPADEQQYAGDLPAAEAERSIKDAKDIAAAYRDHRLHFNMRTFESAMYFVAQESGDFKQLMNSPDPDYRLHYKNIQFEGDGYGTIAFVTRKEDGTRFAVRPILTIQYGDVERFHLSELIGLKYHGSDYAVGDLNEADFSKDPMWGRLNGMTFPNTENKTVFTLLTYLFSQNSISPAKLPPQQLIQVQQ